MFKPLLKVIPSHLIMVVAYVFLGAKDESGIGNPTHLPPPAPRIIKRVPLPDEHLTPPKVPPVTVSSSTLSHHGNWPTFHRERQLVFVGSILQHPT